MFICTLSMWMINSPSKGRKAARRNRIERCQMAIGTKDFSKIPPSAQAAAALISKRFPDLDWRYVSSYTVPDRSKGHQMRADLPEATRKATVRRYAQDMKAGDEFPGFVVTLDGHILDGLHRRDALEELGMTTFHAIVIRSNFNGAPEALLDEFGMLGLALNKPHGERLSKVELEKAIAAFIGEHKPSDIARMTGVTVTTVKDIIAAEKARRLARNLDVDVSGVSRTSLKHVGAHGDQITEPVAKELFGLMAGTSITANEVAHLMDRLSEQGTEARKVAVVRSERSSRATEEVGERTTVSLSRQAKMHGSFFLEYEGREGLLVEKNQIPDPDTGRTPGEDYHAFIWRAIAVLRKVAAQQESINSVQSKE
jgi:hypothetical protein